jgi:hypothetical protein
MKCDSFTNGIVIQLHVNDTVVTASDATACNSSVNMWQDGQKLLETCYKQCKVGLATLQGLVGNVTQYSITYLTHTRPGVVATNLELHAQNDPALGPITKTDPGFFCNGTQLTTAQDTLDNAKYVSFLH